MNQTLNQTVSASVFLEPAYGRQYKTREAALQDWQAGRDFNIEGGPYCSRRDIAQLYQQFGRVYIRYSRGTLEV